MKRLILAALVAATTLSAFAAEPTDADKAKRSTMDIRSIATAVEAYATDHNAYPPGKSMDDVTPAIVTVYIRFVPQKDAWGTAYRYWSDGAKYRLVSCGADATCDESTWTNVSTDPLPSFNDDAVYQNGSFLRFWNVK
jgi:type II secretory pathway pseudopilin PulG